MMQWPIVSDECHPGAGLRDPVVDLLDTSYPVRVDARHVPIIGSRICLSMGPGDEPRDDNLFAPRPSNP